MRLIIARQNRTSRPQVISHQAYDRIRFVRDGAIYEGRSGDALLTQTRAGDELVAVGLPFVDNTWQNFGEERVLGHVKNLRSQPAREILEAVFTDIAAFTGGAPATDDRTLVLLKA